MFHASIVFNISTAMIRSVISFYSLGNGHISPWFPQIVPTCDSHIQGRLAVAAAYCLDL